MKRTCSIKPVLAALLLTACDTSTEARFGEPEAIRSITYLKSLCEGTSVAVRHDITIRGRVTGNDRFGEFYKTLVIEDTGGGISIAADHTELWPDYPFGSEVTVRCNGLSLLDYGGKILLGTTPGESGVGRIPARELHRYLRVSRPEGVQTLPLRLSIPEIGIQHTDTYVRLDGVRFSDTGNWCDTDPETDQDITTEHRITDQAGNAFVVRTSGTCIYAKEPVPEGTGTLCGVIDYFNGKLSLRVTNYEAEFPIAARLPTACPSTAGCATPKPRR